MASTSRVDVIKKRSNGTIFISWKEQFVNESPVDRRVEFFLQIKNFDWILAVTGLPVNDNEMEFVIDPTFYLLYKEDITGLEKGEWKKRCDVVVWLKAQISNRPFSENNDNKLSDEHEHMYQVMTAGDFSMIIDSEGAKARLAFPSGYTDAYSIPSKAQIFLKLGTRNFDVKVEDGYLTDGWNYFVSEHGIKCGYVVQFQFHGHSTYQVEVFDWKRGKKVYPWSHLIYHEWI